MGEKIDGFAGSLVNIVLGALILWVGQTTYRHAGQLASIDQKFEGVTQQFKTVDDRLSGFRTWLDKAVSGLKDEDRMLATTDDADKLASDLRKLDTFASNVERRLTDRLGAVEVKLASLETQHLDSQELAQLRAEVAQLRYAVSQPIVPAAAQYQTAERTMNGTPVYLPPVEIRR
jgi:hypothetical protein